MFEVVVLTLGRLGTDWFRCCRWLRGTGFVDGDHPVLILLVGCDLRVLKLWGGNRPLGHLKHTPGQCSTP